MNFNLKIIFILIIVLFTNLHSENLGHRLGGDIYGAENTIHTYKKAIKNLQKKKLFKYVELDIQETKDSQIILFHDKTIEKLVPKSKHNLKVLKNILKKKKFHKIEIKDLTLKETSQLILEQNSKIPTLKELLDVSIKLKVYKPIHIEVKNLYSDKARLELIELASTYSKHQKISFIAFQKNFYKSFPNTQRWLKIFQKNNLKFYQIDKHEFTKEKLKNTPKEYKVLLEETKFSIKNKTQRTQSFTFEIKEKLKKNTYINIGIYNGHDNSGDNGLNFKVENQNGKWLMANFSKKKDWEWFRINIKNNQKLILTIEDNDTSFKGKFPGNGGLIKILLEIN
ncbi:MAG: Unknown protein [uncultured Sulfurovum sp.]|uniref:GP-PDE domain-containing protein n=1 Tax=uncultured Sulfurovum sp. TaxID=269237 RepID=A0A6S6RYE2_9BACT|nr:MAG: Unknown protein [uncultured Sulfurovum sp.]